MTIGRNRRLLIVAIVVAALAAALAWLPDLGLRYGVLRGLGGLGWSQVSVDRTALSLLHGAVVIRRLDAATAANGGGDTAGLDLGGLDLRFDWRKLFSRRIWLPDISLDQLRLDLRRDRGGGWTVSGLPLPSGGDSGQSGPSAWTWGLGALTLTNSRLAIHDGDFHAVVDVDRLRLTDLVSWDPEQPATLDLAGRLDGVAIAIAGQVRPFAAAGPALALTIKTAGLAVDKMAAWGGLAGWRGRLDADVGVSATLGAAPRAEMDGSLAVADVLVPIEDGSVSARRLAWQGRQQWSGDLHLAGKAQLDGFALTQGPIAVSVAEAAVEVTDAATSRSVTRIDWTGGLQGRDWHLSMGELSVDHQSLAWTGRSQVDLAAQARILFSGSGHARSEGSVVVDGSARLAARTIDASGDLAHTRATGGLLPPLEGRVALSVTGLELRQSGRVWLTSDRAAIGRLDLAPTGIAAPKVTVGGLTALSWPGRYGPRLAAAEGVVQGLEVSPKGAIAAAELALTRPLISLSRDGAGLAGISDLGGGEAKAVPPPPPAKSATPPATAISAPAPDLRLGRLVLAGAGRIDFRDATTSRPVRLELSDLQVTVGEMDSARPGRDTPLSASARIGDARLGLSGRFRPLQPLADGTFKGQVAHLELPPLSPYLADNLGVDLQTGQLDAKIDLGLRDGKLDGRMDLTLERLAIAPPDPAAPLVKHSDLPIETGLDLLRDSEGRIRLTIPVSGDVGAPDFDFSDAINQAIGGALKSTVLTTLKVAFPLVGLISLAIDSVDEPAKMALPALAFAPGVALVTELNEPALTEIGGLMRQQDRIKLNLCGVAVRAIDTVPLLGPGQTAPPAEVTERLRRLAETRAAVTKTWLVERGVDAGRLFTCHPRIEDAAAKGGPRVEVLF